MQNGADLWQTAGLLGMTVEMLEESLRPSPPRLSSRRSGCQSPGASYGDRNGDRIGREQTETNVDQRDKNSHSFKVSKMKHHVRDVGVAGSNPATPTSPLSWALIYHNYLDLLELGGDRVHKRVHRRVLRMVSLAQDSKGNYRARKRLPDDVREEYGRLYGARHEAKFNASSGLTKQEATRRYGEWLAEVETRISSIRAQRNGQGVSLTRMRTRALAGEWYDWFIERHPLGDIQVWTDLKDKVQSAFQLTISEKECDESDPDDLFREREDVRQALRPVLADVAETAQFLAGRRIALDNETRNQFLDFLYDDLSAALNQLIRIKKGDFRTAGTCLGLPH